MDRKDVEPVEPAQLAMIEHNVRITADMLGAYGIREAAPSRAGVACLDGFIDRNRAAFDEPRKHKLRQCSAAMSEPR